MLFRSTEDLVRSACPHFIRVLARAAHAQALVSSSGRDLGSLSSLCNLSIAKSSGYKSWRMVSTGLVHPERVVVGNSSFSLSAISTLLSTFTPSSSSFPSNSSLSDALWTDREELAGVDGLRKACRRSIRNAGKLRALSFESGSRSYWTSSFPWYREFAVISTQEEGMPDVPHDTLKFD